MGRLSTSRGLSPRQNTLFCPNSLIFFVWTVYIFFTDCKQQSLFCGFVPAISHASATSLHQNLSLLQTSIFWCDCRTTACFIAFVHNSQLHLYLQVIFYEFNFFQTGSQLGPSPGPWPLNQECLATLSFLGDCQWVLGRASQRSFDGREVG